MACYSPPDTQQQASLQHPSFLAAWRADDHGGQAGRGEAGHAWCRPQRTAGQSSATHTRQMWRKVLTYVSARYPPAQPSQGMRKQVLSFFFDGGDWAPPAQRQTT